MKRSAAVLVAQLEADEKAGARLPTETRAAIAQAIDLLTSLSSSVDTPSPETSKSTEDETVSRKSSGPDLDIAAQILLLREI